MYCHYDVDQFDTTHEWTSIQQKKEREPVAVADTQQINDLNTAQIQKQRRLKLDSDLNHVWILHSGYYIFGFACLPSLHIECFLLVEAVYV